MNDNYDNCFMSEALELAALAMEQNEVPVGAVLVKNNEIIGRGFNQPISSQDPTGHAEIIALRDAALKIGNYRLVDTTLYVTLEPCVMCLGAMIHARIKRLVFGAYDSKSGAVETVFQLLNSHKFNHRIEYQGGLLEKECGEILKNFFRRKR